MTEKTNAVVEAFILQWGDLGTQWGVNRSVAQIHAFLYLQSEPVTAERIAGEFSIARSNVSTSLKELQAWRLVRRVPVRGDRRDHFVAETDPWEIAQRIAEGRKQRELDPALATLARCVEDARTDPGVSATERERLEALHAFTRTADNWYGQMLALPRERLETLMKLGAKVARFLPKPRT